MKRLGLILAASWLVTASVARAGELDAEYGEKTKPINVAAPTLDKPASELDAELPTQACCIKRWLCGCKRYTYVSYSYYGGYGYGRGYCGIGYGYGGYGGFGGYGGGFGYGGFGGYGGGFY